MLRLLIGSILMTGTLGATPDMDDVARTTSAREGSRETPTMRPDQNPARADAEYSIDTMLAALQQLRSYLNRRIQSSGMENGVAMYRKAEIHQFLNITEAYEELNAPPSNGGQQQFYGRPQGVIALFIAKVKITDTVAGMNQRMQLVQNIARYTGGENQQSDEMPQAGQSRTKTRFYLVSFKAVQGPMAYEQAAMHPMIASAMQAAGADTPEVSEEMQALLQLLPMGARRSKISRLSEDQIRALQGGEAPSDD